MECNAIQALAAIVEQLIQDLADAFLPRRLLGLRAVADVTVHLHAVADILRLHDQRETVG